jgi:hypothetical protein
MCVVLLKHGSDCLNLRRHARTQMMKGYVDSVIHDYQYPAHEVIRL